MSDPPAAIANLSTAEKRQLLAHLLQEKADQDRLVYPLSYGQQALWFLYKTTPQSYVYNVAPSIRIRSEVDVPTLQRAFQYLMDRHPCLRTTFSEQSDLVQIAAGYQEFHLQQIDASTWSEAELHQRVTEAAQQPFDLEQGPLIRVSLFTRDPQNHVLLFVLHHILSDAWSVGILLNELAVIYPALKAGHPISLPKLEHSYADFVSWQQNLLDGPVGDQQRQYWQAVLAGDLPPLNLPSDRPRTSSQTDAGASESFKLSPTLTQQLKKFAQAEDVTLYMLLLAIFEVLLARITGQEDILVGTPVAGRNRPEFGNIVGYFVNPVILRANLGGDPTFIAFLKQVRQTVQGALAHQDYPFARLVEQLQPERDPNRLSIFQAVFNLVPALGLEAWLTPPSSPAENRASWAGLVIEPFEIGQQEGVIDLSLEMIQTKAEIIGRFKYQTDLFETATIQRMVGHFQTLLQGILDNPEQKISQLPLLTEAERHQLLVTWNETTVDYPYNKCIHHLFEEQVERTPEAIALIFEDQQLTYRALNSRANQLARHLMDLGVGPETVVGLCIERSLEMVVGLLGILKAGGAYVPLDPTYPSERLAFMIENVQLSALLTQETLLTALPEIDGQVICLDRDWPKIAHLHKNNPRHQVSPDNLAYIIYTSGSTGQPKGVLIEHRGLCNVAQAQRQMFRLGPQDRLLQFSSLSFDAATGEMVMALCAGATLCLGSKEALAPGPPLLQFLQKHNISIVTLTPSTLATLPVESLPALHTITVAGEACPTELVTRWADNHSFFNLYGPTEATIWTTALSCKQNLQELKDNQTVPLGRPISNTQLYILDRHRQLVPQGVAGELYIGGVGLARGYHNQPELTAEKFIPNPFGAGKLYKTGDLVRYVSGGTSPPIIEFLGRVDHQVKLRGYRIELGEIETTLTQHPAVHRATVIVRQDQPHHQQLVAYIARTQTPEDKNQVESDPNLSASNASLISDLRAYLRQKLPSYMIPGAFIELDQFPVTLNGKFDRRALPAPDDVASGAETDYIAPRTPLEAQLVAIWAKVLGLNQVGVLDNFFDVGGHSLIAVQLIKEIKEQLGRELPLTTLFLGGTVAEMAQALQPNLDLSDNNTNSAQVVFAKTGSTSLLVPLQSSGSKPPLFWIHPLLGVVFPYTHLASRLKSDHPIYALQSVDLGNGRPLYTRIEEMATYYLKVIRQAQPQGPYHLGGWSLGGMIAFEMAQQLHEAGESVPLLVVLDTPASFEVLSFWKRMALGPIFVSRVGRNIWPFVGAYLDMQYPLPTKKPSGWVRFLRRLKQLWHSLRKNTANGANEDSLSTMEGALTFFRVIRLFRTNVRAMQTYRPKPYPGQLTLFRVDDRVEDEYFNQLGWADVVEGGVDLHFLPGNHFTLLQPPHVEELAQQLNQILNRL